MDNWRKDLIPYDEKYENVATIGEGRYGLVYVARNIQTREIVAVKEIKRDSSDGFPFNTLREIELLQSIKHKNVVELKEVVTDPSLAVFLIFDYAEYDLDYLLQRTILSERQVKSYIRQLLLGMYVLHQRFIYHRDLKPQNILVKKSNIVEIADFGLAKQIFPQEKTMKNMTPGLITAYYRPIEIFLKAPKYGQEVDIWSLGCIFYEMMTRRTLFHSPNVRKDRTVADNENAIVQQIFTVCGYPDDRDWPEWRNYENSRLYASMKVPNPGNLNDFLSQTLPPQYQEAKPILLGMLQYNPRKRWTIEQVLTHPFLHNINNCLDPSRLEPLSVPTKRQFDKAMQQNTNVKRKMENLSPTRIYPKLI